MTTSLATITEASTKDTWERFYQDAVQFFESEPSPMIYRKVQRYFELGFLNSAFIEIFRHLLAMDIQYNADEWAGPAFRPLFRSASSNPLHEFIPESFRQLAAKPSVIRSCLNNFLDHHDEVFRKDLRRLCREISADRGDFKSALHWAQRQEASVLTILCFTINRNEAAPICPNWTISEWLTDLHTLQNEYPWRLEEIQLAGREELRIGGARVNQELRAKFDLAPASAEELEQHDEYRDFMTAELAWITEARRKLNATSKEAVL